MEFNNKLFILVLVLGECMSQTSLDKATVREYDRGDIEKIQKLNIAATNEWGKGEEEPRNDTEDEERTSQMIVEVINTCIVRMTIPCWLNMVYDKGTKAGRNRLIRDPKWCVTGMGNLYIQAIDCEEERTKGLKEAYRNYLLRHISKVALWRKEHWLPSVVDVSDEAEKTDT